MNKVFGVLLISTAVCLSSCESPPGRDAQNPALEATSKVETQTNLNNLNTNNTASISKQTANSTADLEDEATRLKNGQYDKDIFNAVIDAYQSEDNQLGGIRQIKSIEVRKINFVNKVDNHSIRDIIITADIKATEVEGNGRVFVILSKDNGQYKLKFGIVGKLLEYELTDINSDNINEVLLTIEDNGEIYSKSMFIVKYDEFYKAWRTILSNCLEMRKDGFPYSFKNSYSFKTNDKDPLLKDIVFHIKTFFDTSLYDKAKWRGTLLETIPEEVDDKVVFTLIGDEFITDKDAYDYMKLFIIRDMITG